MSHPADQDVDRLVSGVGQVCIAASSLEWSLTYLTGVIEGWDGPKFLNVFGSPGKPLEEFRNLVPRLGAFGPDVANLLADAERLLAACHQVVHSVMMLEAETVGGPIYKAWQEKSGTIWPVVPEDLNTLAQDLAHCTVEAIAFADA